MAGIALSRLHITPVEFYMLCPAELHYALTDHAERERLSLETNLRALWETTRISLFWHFNMNPYKKKPLQKLEQVFRLRWDEKEEQTVEQMTEMVKAIAVAFGGNRKSKTRPNSRRKRVISGDNAPDGKSISDKNRTVRTAGKQQKGAPV
jgi:hypothetical protein